MCRIWWPSLCVSVCFFGWQPGSQREEARSVASLVIFCCCGGELRISRQNKSNNSKAHKSLNKKNKNKPRRSTAIKTKFSPVSWHFWSTFAAFIIISLWSTLWFCLYTRASAPGTFDDDDDDGVLLLFALLLTSKHW